MLGGRLELSSGQFLRGNQLQQSSTGCAHMSAVCAPFVLRSSSAIGVFAPSFVNDVFKSLVSFHVVQCTGTSKTECQSGASLDVVLWLCSVRIHVADTRQAHVTPRIELGRDRNLRTDVLHQITLRINNRSNGRFAAVSGAFCLQNTTKIQHLNKHS